jgi:hypothetical protein
VHASEGACDMVAMGVARVRERGKGLSVIRLDRTGSVSLTEGSDQWAPP